MGEFTGLRLGKLFSLTPDFSTRTEEGSSEPDVLETWGKIQKIPLFPKTGWGALLSVGKTSSSRVYCLFGGHVWFPLCQI